MLVVSCEFDPEFRPKPPQRLFKNNYDPEAWGHQHYDVHPDGRHFAVVDLGENADPKEIRLIVAWGEELARRLPLTPR